MASLKNEHRLSDRLCIQVSLVLVLAIMSWDTEAKAPPINIIVSKPPSLSEVSTSIKARVEIQATREVKPARAWHRLVQDTFPWRATLAAIARFLRPNVSQLDNVCYARRSVFVRQGQTKLLSLNVKLPLKGAYLLSWISFLHTGDQSLLWRLWERDLKCDREADCV